MARAGVSASASTGVPPTSASRPADSERERPAYNYDTTAPMLSDREGVSVFFKDDEGALYHTYSTYGRGIDLLNAAYNYLDLVPLGRGEEGHPNQYWVRRHDEYDA